MMNNKGLFVISLDFEMHWGMFDVLDLKQNKKYFEETLKGIPLILDLFLSNNIEATWAIVGMMMNNDIHEFKRNLPSTYPNYHNKKLSTYNILNEYDENFHRYYFCKNLINEILNSKGQSIGTHTYSHYYCLESGQTSENFEEDLLLAIKVAEKLNIKLSSLVYPRNQYNIEYNKICQRNGINIVRTNPSSWFWSSTSGNSIFKKMAIGLDTYLPLSNNSYSLDKVSFEGTVLLPASRLFKPHTGIEVFDKMKVRRIKKELYKAAINNEVYHLWWHPHNFGNNLKKSMDSLSEIINYFNELKETFGMKSVSMESFYKDYVNKKDE